MKRVSLISGFILMVLSMLIMPNYPALHYYFGVNKTTFYNADKPVNRINSFVSDLNYLHALVQRTKDIQKTNKTATPPPKPQKEVNSFVYLISDISLHLQLTAVPFHFKPYLKSWHGRFIPLGYPPPKA